jgi:hypothetical protein
MKSISFLKDAATSVVLAGVMLAVAGVVSAQIGGAGGGGVGSAGIGGGAGSVGVPGAANVGTVGIPGGAGDAGRAGIAGQAGDVGSAGGAGGMVSPGMVSPGMNAVDSMTGQSGSMGGRPPYTPGSAVSGEAPRNPGSSSTSGSERQGYGLTGVTPGGVSTTPGASSGTGE